jgi:ribosomal protein S27AE
MARTCPDCGTAVEYSTHTAYVLNGTCGQCGLVLTVMQDAPGSASAPAGPPTDRAPGEARPARGSEPPCPACGSALAFQVSSGGGIEATCSGCGATAQYVPVGAERHGEFPVGRRRPERPSDSGPGFGPSRARPCRECGGPLRFTTTPDGTVSGECESCGNRFVLPPRRDGDGGRGGGGGRRFDRNGGPRYGGGGGGGRRYGRPPPGRFRPRERRDDDSEDERPRRRPRRE